jgi:hypothetical protein
MYGTNKRVPTPSITPSTLPYVDASALLSRGPRYRYTTHNLHRYRFTSAVRTESSYQGKFGNYGEHLEIVTSGSFEKDSDI